ncbi:hypothetical protein [Vibrio scophthalmi]|uniref:Uncharacterized protein n=1 Tax=Vibrio scophthalmi TaxID=45658 RepID=A0A1E3WRJ3_9VIBR|nr:hypothetical protein [Vibrio scophthalmi]ODS12398.1 hypothetical protein VSF3289_02702 [Vibrio scophthalmi]
MNKKTINPYRSTRNLSNWFSTPQVDEFEQILNGLATKIKEVPVTRFASAPNADVATFHVNMMEGYTNFFDMTAEFTFDPEKPRKPLLRLCWESSENRRRDEFLTVKQVSAVMRLSGSGTNPVFKEFLRWVATNDTGFSNVH